MTIFAHNLQIRYGYAHVRHTRTDRHKKSYTDMQVKRTRRYEDYSLQKKKILKGERDLHILVPNHVAYHVIRDQLYKH